MALYLINSFTKIAIIRDCRTSFSVYFNILNSHISPTLLYAGLLSKYIYADITKAKKTKIVSTLKNITVSQLTRKLHCGFQKYDKGSKQSIAIIPTKMWQF